jgi:translation elongation factor EF-G
MKERLGVNAVPIQLPIGAESKFVGLIDLIRMKAYVWSGEELGAAFTVGDIPADMVEKAKQYREKLVEAMSDFDDKIAEKFLNGQDVSAEDLVPVIRKAVVAGKFYPMLCGSTYAERATEAIDNVASVAQAAGRSACTLSDCKFICTANTLFEAVSEFDADFTERCGQPYCDNSGVVASHETLINNALK